MYCLVIRYIQVSILHGFQNQTKGFRKICISPFHRTMCGRITLKCEWWQPQEGVDAFSKYCVPRNIVDIFTSRISQAGGRLVSDHGGGRGPGARLVLHRQHPLHAPHRDSRQRPIRSHHHRRVRRAGSVVGFINNLRLKERRHLDPWNTCKVKVIRWISGQVTPTALLREH